MYHLVARRTFDLSPRYQSVVDQFYGRTLVITLKCPSESGVYEVLKKFKDLLFVKFSLVLSDYLIQIHSI